MSPGKKKTKPNSRVAKAARSPKESAAQLPVVGIVAPSAPAPRIELARGVQRLSAAGFRVYCHPQVRKCEGFFAGNDAERAFAFLDYAFDPELDVVWAARGGYGAVRILPILDEVVAQAGIPEPKTFVGFSDETILLDYVRRRWGWRAIHGPMPATQHAERIADAEFAAVVRLVSGVGSASGHALCPVYRPPGFGAKSGAEIEGALLGGNLAMIASVVGTPYAFELAGSILFLEEVSEAAYRIDRMLQHLTLAGALAGVRAIVLGTFTDCRDSAPDVYAEEPRGRGKPKLKKLRPILRECEVVECLFAELGETLGIPVFRGLPVGHGSGTGALELGVPASLGADGAFRTRTPRG